MTGNPPPGVATTLNQILIGDTASAIGTARAAAIPGHQIAGKTGTTNEEKDAWFIGYTPDLVVGVFVAVVIANFAYLYPVLTDELLPYPRWLTRMWFRSWI